MSRARAEDLGLTWVAEIGAHGVVAGPDSTLQVAAGPGDRQGVCAGGARPEGFGSGGDQRGIRGGGDRIDARTRT
jgi:hypothetical protein